MRLKYTFEMMELDDKTVAVPVGEKAEGFHGVIQLNETAAFIFHLLKDETTVEEIINTMSKEFDASKEILTVDVHRCIDEFRRRGILVM